MAKINKTASNDAQPIDQEISRAATPNAVLVAGAGGSAEEIISALRKQLIDSNADHVIVIGELKGENESLLAQIKQLHADHLILVEGKDAEIESLKEYFEAHLNEIAGYKTVIGDLDKEIAKLHIELKEAQEIANDALNSFNTAAVKVADPLEAEVKGKRVKINHGVDLHGKRYTANELADNAEVLEELFEIGSGSITLID